jgi:PAS domain S-box-containing protein
MAMSPNHTHAKIAPLGGEFSARPFDFNAWLETWQEEIVFFRVDGAERIDYVSPSVGSILGYEPEEMLGRVYREYFDPSHPLCDQLRDVSSRMLAHDSPESKRCVAQRRDGQYVFMLLRERDIFDARGSFTGREMMAQEVTRRVEAELWLRQSERKYRRLVEQFRGDYIIYSRDSRGMITYVSPSVEALLGYPRDEVVGRNWRDVIKRDPDGMPLELRTRDGGDAANPLREVVTEITRRDGARRVFEIQEWSILGIDGQCVAMEGIAKDITDARQADEDVRRLKEDLERRVALRTEELMRINEELRASEARYRNVVETQTELIVRWLPDGTRTFVNEPYCRFAGRPASELIGSSGLTLMNPEDMPKYANLLATVTPAEPARSGETRLLRWDGQWRWTEWRTRAYFDAAGKAIEYQSVGRDVTNLKESADLLRQKEAHLAHLSRLATMGEMVAGIAHELGQPLHAANTFAEAARRHLLSGRAGGVDSAVDCSREISTAIVRTVEIIRRLRDFTKAQPVSLESLDLNEIVCEAIEMMAYEIRSVGAGMHLELADGLPPIEGDRIQLEQMCINLLKNACEAMENVPLDKRRLHVGTTTRDGRICLMIKDSGVGLAEADELRLFDAFYSTKPDGMGMGLSLCKSIAEAHHMQIGFTANTDQPGMTFQVALPAQATRKL